MTDFSFNPSEPEIDELVPSQFDQDFSDFDGLDLAFSAPLPDGQRCSFESDNESMDDFQF